ncbi:MAG: redox-sensing transcriptional repressor Rex [Peptostreptococcales bacterium]
MSNKSTTRISNAVIRRLPKYRRYLEELLNKGILRISSKDLSASIGFTASQIRQDLNNFGGFGQQGYGYNVKELYEQISKIILGKNRSYNVIIVGSGNLGQAIANYTHFYRTGFIVNAMFDVNPRLIGLRINDVQVLDAEIMEDYLKSNAVDIGIICTNKESAQSVATKLCQGNVKGIWNFAPIDIVVGENVFLENVHLSDSLHTLSYYINHPEDY